MKKEQIQERLKTHLKIAKEKCKLEDNQILGIFLYGSQNYGLDTEDSDIDSRVIIFPTFEDFCVSPSNLISKEIHLLNSQGKTEHIDIKDVRLYRENIRKQNWTYLETLFTEYFILNPRYEMLFLTKIKGNREEFSRLNEKRAWKAGKGEFDSMVKKNFNENLLFELKKRAYYLEKYAHYHPYEECLKPTSSEWYTLMGLKTHDFPFESEQEKYDMWDECIRQVEKTEKYYAYRLEPEKLDVLEALNEGIVALCKKSFEEDDNVLYTSFKKSLTKTENHALEILGKEIGVEGQVSITKLISLSGISRPVFIGLFQKMKDNSVAEITGMGVKGTHIRFSNGLLREDIKKM